MNGRVVEEPTPEGRLAAVCKSLALRMRKEAELRRRSDYSREPDYADYRDALRPYIEREMLQARLDEISEYCGAPAAAFRIISLRRQIEALDRDIAKLPK